MTTATQVPYVYEGVPIHSRGLTVAAIYDSLWCPPADCMWVEHAYVSECWQHPQFPRHVVWKPESDVVLVAHQSSSPKVGTVLALGRLALGPTATPSRVTTYPLALRLPLRGPGRLALPDGGFRCRRLWPPPGEPSHLDDVDGVPVELRISGSTVKDNVRLYAEAFVGRAHDNKKKQPRSLLFSADARHVLLEDRRQVKRFTARLMDLLLGFAYWRQDEGLEVDHRALPGRQVGRVQMCADIDDVEFAIRLPRTGGVLTYVGSYVTH